MWIYNSILSLGREYPTILIAFTCNFRELLRVAILRHCYGMAVCSSGRSCRGSLQDKPTNPERVSVETLLTGKAVELFIVSCLYFYSPTASPRPNTVETRWWWYVSTRWYCICDIRSNWRICLGILTGRNLSILWTKANSANPTQRVFMCVPCEHTFLHNDIVLGLNVLTEFRADREYVFRWIVNVNTQCS